MNELDLIARLTGEERTTIELHSTVEEWASPYPAYLITGLEPIRVLCPDDLPCRQACGGGPCKRDVTKREAP